MTGFQFLWYHGMIPVKEPVVLVETFYNIGCPVSIALLADFHNNIPDPVLESLRSHKPKIIAIAGDFIFGDMPKGWRIKIKENFRALKLLQECPDIAPTFVSLGNHEYTLSDEDYEVLRSTKVTLLDNTWTNYHGMVIGGLSSPYCKAYQEFRAKQGGTEQYPKPIPHIRTWKVTPSLAWLDEFEKQNGYKILLCHHPEYYPKYLKDRKIDLILSGHCHGGQWRYYSLIHHEMRGFYAPGQGFFPSLTSGVHDGKLVISRGLSNPTTIPRINNPEEIVYIM